MVLAINSSTKRFVVMKYPYTSDVEMTAVSRVRCKDSILYTYTFALYSSLIPQVGMTSVDLDASYEYSALGVSAFDPIERILYAIVAKNDLSQWLISVNVASMTEKASVALSMSLTSMDFWAGHHLYAVALHSDVGGVVFSVFIYVPEALV